MFWTSSQKKPILTAPNAKNKFWSSYETLESTGEVKLMMKFCLWLYNFSELKFIFSSSHGQLFLVLFQAIIYIFSF